MSIEQLNDQYWNDRWKNGETAWDIGYASPAIVAFIETLTSKNVRILIPGCGNAYEAEYLHSQGFTDVTVVDFAAEALAQFAKRVPNFPKEHLVQSDFFLIENRNYDVVLEQTFFCALDPSLRTRYVSKMHEVLKENGVLGGLFFDDPIGGSTPPFGATTEEYLSFFGDHFSIRILERCTNSIVPRAGRELWFEFVKA